jgi:hypothetical protein
MNAIPSIKSFEQFERETTALIQPFKSRFGAIPWHERHAPRASKHEWLVKNVITRGEQAMLVGASQSGKSFLAIDIGMAVARGTPWFGNKTRKGLVIYQAGESAKGVRDKRIPAYEEHHGLKGDNSLPFVLLTLPIDLYASDEDCDALIAECRYWEEQYPDFKLELLVIDTFSAATPGADENGSKDVSSIRRRCKKLELALGCTVLLVHHKNAAGTKARGHTSMFADVENVLDVSLVEVEAGKSGKNPIVAKDANGRKIREAVVTKLKDGDADKRFRFVLPQVKIGADEDGDELTSCVVDLPDEGALAGIERDKPQDAKKLSDRVYNYFICVQEAIQEHGEAPPDGIKLPGGIRVVHKDKVRDAFAKKWMGEEPEGEKRDAALRQARKFCGEKLVALGLIGISNPWVWLTGKELRGGKKGQSPQPEEHTPVTQWNPDVTEDEVPW